MRNPTPIAKNATYPDALKINALVKSFIVRGGRRSHTVRIARRFSVFLKLDARHRRNVKLSAKAVDGFDVLICVKKSLLPSENGLCRFTLILDLFGSARCRNPPLYIPPDITDSQAYYGRSMAHYQD